MVSRRNEKVGNEIETSFQNSRNNSQQNPDIVQNGYLEILKTRNSFQTCRNT